MRSARELRPAAVASPLSLMPPTPFDICDFDAKLATEVPS